MFFELFLFAVTAAFTFYLWQRHAYGYWKRHNVKFLRPTAIFGNFRELFLMRKSFPVLLDSLHNDPSLNREDAVVGIFKFFEPALLLRDVTLIKRIMIKDFSQFTNRVLQADPHHDPLGHHNLFLTQSTHWRELRSKLSPVFTSGKIKQMYPLMSEVGRELESLLQTIASGTTTNIKDISNRFTNEMIATIAFGIRADSLHDPKNTFYLHMLAVFEATFKRAFDGICMFALPALTSLLRVKFLSGKTSEFMRREMAHIISERERTRAKRNDLVDALIGMKKEALANPDKANPARDPDFLVAQAALFQTAGYETSATTMTYTLYELALHPELQERIRAEIRDASNVANSADGEISYEKLQALSLLGQAVDETLRKYPVAGQLERQCTLPSGEKGYSLAPYSNFVIPSGMAIYVSVKAVHYDEQYWPEPEKYDPERFAPENRKNINMDAYMPFGIGPRNCLGMRIGLLQAKLGLIHLLKNHRVEPCKETPKVIRYDERSPLLASKPDIHLKLIRAEN